MTFKAHYIRLAELDRETEIRVSAWADGAEAFLQGKTFAVYPESIGHAEFDRGYWWAHAHPESAAVMSKRRQVIAF